MFVMIPVLVTLKPHVEIRSHVGEYVCLSLQNNCTP
jgi:hypothetical protein